MLKVFDFLTFRLFLDMQYLRNSAYFRAEIFKAILRLQELSMGKISDLNYAISFFHIYTILKAENSVK
jgi:hypothetical protein